MTEQDERNMHTVRRMYAGDEAERRSIARDIVWHVPGHNPVSGDYHGFDAYTQRMPERMAPLTRWDFTLKEVMVNGNYVMTTLHLIGDTRFLESLITDLSRGIVRSFISRGGFLSISLKSRDDPRDVLEWIASRIGATLVGAAQ